MAKKAVKSKAAGKTAGKAAKKSTATKTAKSAVKAAPKKAAKPAVKPAAKKAAPKATAAKTAFKASAPVAQKVTASKSKGAVRFTPLDDRIVVERVVAAEKTAGGLYIPDSAQEKPTTGKVVAVGRGHVDAKGRMRPCDVKVGDEVLFTAWAGTEIEIEGSPYVLMRETDLLGVTSR